MGAFNSLVVVLLLVFLAMGSVGYAGLYGLFGVWIPYAAIVLFLVGIVFRVVRWARSPVPFRIPTSCGQQKSLSFIKPARLENPQGMLGVLGRMALEVLLFRSLFRNTKTQLVPERKVTYASSKWLWLGAMAFHYSFLVIFLRHLRFFSEPIPTFVTFLQDVDGFLQVGVPVVYITSIVFVVALSYLFLRRIVVPTVRYISLMNDFFPLFLLLGIGTTGILLRHFAKTDIVTIKKLTIGLLRFGPELSQLTQVDPLFFGHFFLVCVLFAVFPYSKLCHMAGIFLSPTRNMANNNRMVRHINPWNYPVKVHTYEEYEDDFREKMKAAGIPVDKE